MSTPILNQYKKIKAEHKDELLLFRMGDFYEFFYEDAKIASKILGIALTSKPMGKGIRVPLAGIPAKAADGYISKLLQKGYKVAICEQVGENNSGLMERKVVEIITPGTVFSPTLLEDKSHNYIAALYTDKERAGVAYCDITTGDFFVFEDNLERALTELERIGATEVLVEEEMELPLENLTSRDPYEFDLFKARDEIKSFFNTSRLDAFELEDSEFAVRAAGALVSYLREKKPGMLEHIRGIKKLRLSNFMYIDPQTIKNLEIVEKIRPDTEGLTLFEVLDHCKTPMGSRRLKESLLSPFLSKGDILVRLTRVNHLVQNQSLLKKIQEVLSDISDIERQLGRISANKTNPRELVRFAKSLSFVPQLEALLGEYEEWKELVTFPDIEGIDREILRTIVDDPPVNFNLGGVVRDGVNPELDELRDISRHGKDKLLELERRERARTGIQNLRIGYNSVFGYYIEVTKSNLHLVPQDYIRKQTLTNAERFITEELKELEDKILGAEERSIRLENEIVKQLRQRVLEKSFEIKRIAEKIAEIDLITSLADVAIKRRYVMPEIKEDGRIEIKDGRHPIVEVGLKGETFVPNDTFMDLSENRVFIITGPNMSGKSTYLRQVAIITIMAHIGSFVPAASAKIGLVDRVFSRIGASDDLARGISTFMAEMIETAQILHNATNRSLIILDEVGRGTSTFDGLAIAWAVVEYIADFVGAKTLFATHYHELSILGRKLKGVRNFTIAVKEWGDEIIFLRKLIPGESDRSYGIHVAKLAGIPGPVIRRAKEILKDLEKGRKSLKVKAREETLQLDIFKREESEKESRIVEILKGVDPDTLSPREALELIYKLKEELKK